MHRSVTASGLSLNGGVSHPDASLYQAVRERNSRERAESEGPGGGQVKNGGLESSPNLNANAKEVPPNMGRKGSVTGFNNKMTQLLARNFGLAQSQELDMNRITLQFKDPNYETKYWTFYSNIRFGHMKRGLYLLTLFLLAGQVVYLLDGPRRFETGLPTTKSIVYFAGVLLITCLSLVFLPNHPKFRSAYEKLRNYLNYLFYVNGLCFIIYLNFLIKDLVHKLNDNDL